MGSISPEQPTSSRVLMSTWCWTCWIPSSANRLSPLSVSADTPVSVYSRRSASSPKEQLAQTGTIDQVRDRHATYFADQAIAHWAIWDGPGQRVALDWLDVELGNLRVGFRWATDRNDLVTAAAIAAHSTMLG